MNDNRLYQLWFTENGSYWICFGTFTTQDLVKERQRNISKECKGTRIVILECLPE